VLTDATGNIAWKTAYSPFGQAQILVQTVENPYRFSGQYYDVETGYHYNWHRYYDPKTGRYLSPDPIGLAGGINPYVYVGGDPVNWIDPSGEFRFGIRPLGRSPVMTGYPEGGGTNRLFHEHGFYENGANVGYFPRGIDQDDPSNLNKYEMFGPYYDDAIMRQAEENLRKSGNWHPKNPADSKGYSLTSHNCEDFASALRSEYDGLGGPIYDSRMIDISLDRLFR
jgi:RHS repeat-associated protein